MKPLTLHDFEQWLAEYGRASAANDPQASAALFAENAQYYETPFAQPMSGREAIYEYWNAGAQNLKDKASAYEVLALKDNRGIARWQAKFTPIETGKRMILDCVFLVEFDERGQCSVFREWWHLQASAVNPYKP